MIHIFKYTKGKRKGKFDFATIVNGKFISGSINQGYERIKSVFSAIKTQQFGRHTGYETNYPTTTVIRTVEIQDDTNAVSTRIRMYSNGKKETLNIKPKKRYHP